MAVSQPAQTQTSGGGSDVRVVSFNAERTAGYFTVHYLVTGIINNQGSAESGQIQLKLTVSDHGEPVIQREFTPVTSPLQPGQSAEFSVPFNIDGNIDFQYLVEVISQ